MKNVLILLVLALSCCQRMADERQRTIPYPAPEPDSSALTFLPGIVSTDSLDFNAAFSPDGQSYYFSRSANDVSDIYVTQYRDGKWQAPRMASFSSGESSEADPAFSPEGALYFISDRPMDEADTLRDFNIWYVTPVNDTQWSYPVYESAVNTDSTEYYISFAMNGNLYFASNRGGGFGLIDIYVSKREGDRYSPPVNLGPSVNGPEVEHDPFISPNEQVLFFTSVNRHDTRGTGDLYYAVRQENNAWSKSQNLGETINTDSYDFCPYVSPDKEFFFFSSQRDVKWIDLKLLPDGLADRITQE